MYTDRVCVHFMGYMEKRKCNVAANVGPFWSQLFAADIVEKSVWAFVAKFVERPQVV